MALVAFAAVAVSSCAPDSSRNAARAVDDSMFGSHLAEPAGLGRGSVELPTTANGAVRITETGARTRVSFALRGASPAPLATAKGGLAAYAGALNGNDIFHRLRAEGTEDYVVFESRPAREEIFYDVDVTSVAGLRLVSRTLEFLDATGTPRLRVAPPYVVDVQKHRHDASLSVEGCAYDADPRAPWGRAVTPPGATTCAVRVAWTSDVYPAVLDPAWTTTGSMAVSRGLPTATRLPSGIVLVAGGGGPLASAELYDPGSGTFAATGPMADARSLHTATLLNSGLVLLAGGSVATAELYNPTAGTFSPTGAMSAARFRHTSTLLSSGKVLVAGGFVGPSTAELYDPGTGTFVGTGAMTAPRDYHAAALLGSGKVLIVGSDFGASTTAELFDPTGAGSFSSVGPVVSGREGPTATVLPSGKVLIAGGSVSVGAEIYDPGTGTFITTGATAVMRGNHTATLVSGKVLLAGGRDGNGVYLSSTELFDPTGSGTFGLAGPMTTVRAFHAATLLATGKVLVVGGADTNNNLSSAELYGGPAAPGTACTIAQECASGFCSNGVCCSAACPGTCMTCAAGSGACVAQKNADDDDTCTGTKTCDANGVCKNKVGQACPGGNGDCANAQCVDGYCCGSASCSDACDRCNVAGHLGVCAVAPAGTACDGGYRCDGVNTFCVGACLDDRNCAPSYFCKIMVGCVPQKAKGAACDLVVDCAGTQCSPCATGNCVDVVCCDTACGAGDTTDCEACSVAKGASVDGTCAFFAAGRVCRAASDVCENASTCDGATAVCPAAAFKSATTECAPATECIEHASCTGSSATCPARANKPDGTACSGGQCASGSCVAVDAGVADAGPDGAHDAALDGGGGESGTRDVPDAGASGATGDSSGCGCRTARSSDFGASLFALALPLLVARRRRTAG